MDCCIDIYAGLLGCGKTTLIKRLLETEYRGKRVAVIENEIGSVNLDAAELKTAEVSVREITGGCVCCSVSGSLKEAVRILRETVRPDYIVIEPTGAADLRGLLQTCRGCEGTLLRRCAMLVNARKFRTILKVVGEFYIEQIQLASCIYLNFTETLSDEAVADVRQAVLELNPGVKIIDTPMAAINGETFTPFDLLPKEDPDSGPILQEESLPGTAQAASLEVRSLDAPARMLPRGMSGKNGKTTLYTRTVTFPRPLSPDEFTELKNILSEPGDAEFWRVKGTVPQNGGSPWRLDLTFGDLYEKTAENNPDVPGGQLVLIGPKIQSSRLDEFLRSLKS